MAVAYAVSDEGRTALPSGAGAAGVEARVAQAISAPPEEGLHLLLEALLGALGGSWAQLFALQTSRGGLQLAATCEAGAAAPPLPWLAEQLGRRVAPALFAPQAAPLPPLEAERGSLLLHPLSCAGRLVGALVAFRESPIAREELAGVTPVASAAQLILGVAALQHTLAASDRLSTLGQLAASVTHELRSPLSYVLDNAAYLGEELLQIARRADSGAPAELGSGAARELLRSAEEALDGARRMRELVRDVSAFASADEVTLVPVDVNEAIRAAVRLTRSEVRYRAQVICRLDEGAVVQGNAPRLTQVMVNLLVNAAQAQAGRAPVDNRIVVLSRREGARVVVEVSDNGPGIPPAVLPRIFDAFFSTKAPGEGTGLGLFLCRDIARAHGGTLAVRSSGARGATFTLELPCAAARAAEPVAPVRLVQAC